MNTKKMLMLFASLVIVTDFADFNSVEAMRGGRGGIGAVNRPYRACSRARGVRDVRGGRWSSSEPIDISIVTGNKDISKIDSELSYEYKIFDIKEAPCLLLYLKDKPQVALERAIARINITQKDEEQSTWFHYVAKYGNVQIMNFFVKEFKDVSIDAANKFGETPLRWANSNGIIRYLIEVGVDSKIKSSRPGSRYPKSDFIKQVIKDKEERLFSTSITPLHALVYMFKNKSSEIEETIIWEIINDGTDIFALNNEGKTAYDYALEHENSSIVKVLNDLQTTILERLEMRERLINNIRRKKILRKAIKERIIRIKEPYNSELTLLHYLVIESDIELVKSLIRRREFLEVDFCNNLIRLAVSQGYLDMTKLLAEKTEQGRKYIATIGFGNNDLLIEAIRSNNVGLVDFILKSLTNNITNNLKRINQDFIELNEDSKELIKDLANQVNDSSENKQNILSYLNCLRGIDRNTLNILRNILQMSKKMSNNIASPKRRVDMISFILQALLHNNEREYIKEEIINSKDQKGKTLLMYALEEASNILQADVTAINAVNYDMLQYLWKLGANPFIEDNEGFNLFDQAKKIGSSSFKDQIIREFYSTIE